MSKNGGFASDEDFVRAWQVSSSLTEVSVRLNKKGFKRMTPQRVRLWGLVFREVGVRLKKISRSTLPPMSPPSIHLTSLVDEE